MSSSYPKSFTYYLSRMNNFSRQKVRLSTIANTTFNANDQVVIQLPEGLLDLTSFTITGRAFTADGAAHGVYLPFIEGCIDSCHIEVGGVSVQNGFTNYNDLFNVFRQYQMTDKTAFRKVLQLEGQQPAATASNYTCSNVPFAMYNFLGLLGSVKVLDTTILPPVKIYLRLAPNSILTVHSGNDATKTYKWTDVKASIDILDVSDGVFYNMVAQRLAQAPLEIPFDNYQTVTGTLAAPTQTTRFSTSTDCLTDVIATFKNKDYAGYGANSNTCLSDYFTRGGKATTSEITTSIFSINGIRYPSIPCQNADGEVFIDTAHTLGASQDVLGETDPNMDSLSRWSSNYWVHAHSFTYPDAEDAHRLVGLSGRGNQIMGSFETTGTGSNLLPVVWLKSKSVLRVGASKMVEVVL